MVDTDYLAVTVKNGNNKFVVSTLQTRSVDGLKNYIAREINTTHFDLYKNSVHPKNLMDRKDALFNYFDTIDDSNLTVVVHPTTPKTPSSK
jgi:hypothetical protein